VRGRGTLLPAPLGTDPVPGRGATGARTPRCPRSLAPPPRRGPQRGELGSGELPAEGDDGFADCSLAQPRELTQLPSALAPGRGGCTAPGSFCPSLGFLSPGNTQDTCQKRGRDACFPSQLHFRSHRCSCLSFPKLGKSGPPPTDLPSWGQTMLSTSRSSSSCPHPAFLLRCFP